MRRPLIILFACMIVYGCARDEAPPASVPAPQESQALTSPSVPAIDGASEAQPRVLKADVDCDGAEDTARMEYVEDRVRVTVTLAATKESQSLEFGLGDSMAQESLCGTEATLDVAGMDYDLTEVFGENPEGFRQSKSCKGLRLMGGECDSMHIFWNHDAQHIDWWRL